MRVVVALGGNALLKRGEPMTAEHQRANVRTAAPALAAVAARPRARALPRQRSPGRAPGAAGGGVHRGRAVSARRPRGPDPGHDRLLPRAGAGQPMPPRHAVRDAPDDGRGRPRRPGVRRTRPSSSGPSTPRTQADALAAEKGWAFKQDGDSWRRVVPSPEPRRIFEIRPIRVAARPRRRRDLRRRRRRADHVRPAPTTRSSGSRRSSTRTSPASCSRVRSPPTCSCMATDVDAVYTDWGTPQQAASDRVTPAELRAIRSRPGRWGRRSKRPAASWRRPESAPPSARSTHIEADRRRHGRHPGRGRVNTRTRNGGDMTTFGVHSEVGRLRKVMVHRPELSLQRLTPTNHDDLLFDDVLWVERAQYEHDQFVAKMRERGVEVFLLQDLLGEALAASDEGRRRLIELAASEYTVGLSLVDEVRVALCGDAARTARPAPHRRPDRRRVGTRPRRARGRVPASRPPSTTRACSCCRRCRTRCSPATRRAGSTAACRSTRCSGRPGGSRRTTWPRSTATTRCSPRPTSSTGTRRSATTDGSTRRTSAGPRSRAATCSPSATARC